MKASTKPNQPILYSFNARFLQLMRSLTIKGIDKAVPFRQRYSLATKVEARFPPHIIPLSFPLIISWQLP